MDFPHLRAELVEVMKGMVDAVNAEAGTTMYVLHVQADDDVTVDFGAHTQATDRVAVIATEPMTCNEAWTPMAAGELRCFVGGRSVH